MAPGPTVVAVGAEHLHTEAYTGTISAYVLAASVTASCGGILFGYDVGVTGGVTSMLPFLEKFFPEVYIRQTLGIADDNPYCRYDNQVLQTFTSMMFLCGMVSSLFAGVMTRKLGRRPSMMTAAVLFTLGACIQSSAQNRGMLFGGRAVLGLGLGVGNSVVPLYISEIAPFSWRGGLNMLFQLTTTVGILIAGLVNYAVQQWEHGWRLSLGLAAVFGLGLLVGSVVLPETPNSLIERGHDEQGRAVLRRLRACEDVEAEFDDITDATDRARRVSARASWRALLSPASRPALVTTVLVAAFQQFTGINAIMFYVPVIFNSLGVGHEASLLNTVIINAVNFASTFISILTVDRLGRRFWFLEGGVQMFVSLFVTGIVLARELADSPSDTTLPKATAIGVLIVVCFFVSAFAWSWGPLGWLVPSEIQTLETRAAGMSVAVTINFLFSFIIGQSFLTMLCAMEWGVFLFFAGWVAIMTTFIYFTFPETKAVPVERVQITFARHPFWKGVMGEAAEEIVRRESARNASRGAWAASKAAEEARRAVAAAAGREAGPGGADSSPAPDAAGREGAAAGGAGTGFCCHRPRAIGDGDDAAPGFEREFELAPLPPKDGTASRAPGAGSESGSPGDSTATPDSRKRSLTSTEPESVCQEPDGRRADPDRDAPGASPAPEGPADDHLDPRPPQRGRGVGGEPADPDGGPRPAGPGADPLLAAPDDVPPSIAFGASPRGAASASALEPGSPTSDAGSSESWELHEGYESDLRSTEPRGYGSRAALSGLDDDADAKDRPP